MANVKNWKNGSPRKLREVADRSSRLRGKRGVEKVEDRQPLNLTWILRSGRKNDRVVEAEKGEKERGDGGNYFRFRALGIGYTFSPLGVCLGEVVVVAASFLLAEDGQPVVTWLFHKVKAEPSMIPSSCAKFTIDRFSGRFSTPFRPPPKIRKGRETSDTGSFVRPKWQRFPLLSFLFPFFFFTTTWWSEIRGSRKLEAFNSWVFFFSIISTS